MREEKFRQFLGSILVWSYWTPWRQESKKKRERKRELVTSSAPLRDFSRFTHTRSSVFDLRAVVLVAAPFFPPSFLFPHAAEEIREKGVSKKNSGENESREKEGVGKNVTCQSGESCTSFTGLVGSRPGGARS